MESRTVNLADVNVVRTAHNFFMETRNGDYTPQDVDVLNSYISYVLSKEKHDLPKYKVGLMLICINEPYWPYIAPVVEDARKFFLPGHDVEIMLWSDLPNYESGKAVNHGCDTVFPVDSVGWPYPTLMRYHIMLQQEEYLQKFDYLYYMDADMRIVNVVGDEIIGNLMMAQHPMYALSKNLWSPIEPNPASAAYFKTPGQLAQIDGKTAFHPLYAAGGFQGGKRENFITAMKTMKKGIDDDFKINYIARWNDETHWNKYLFDNPPDVVLSPSYVYPDSLINEYYVKIWGKNYPPKIVTLTKPFTLSKEGGQAAQQMIKTL